MTTTTQLSNAEKADAIRDYQAQTTGSNEIHKHPLGLRYTDGIEFLADTCGAYWLIDVVASHQPAIRRRGHHDFQVWILEPVPEKPRAFRVHAWSDEPAQSLKLAAQFIPYSDFPSELGRFRFFVIDGTMLLPEEY